MNKKLIIFITIILIVLSVLFKPTLTLYTILMILLLVFAIYPNKDDRHRGEWWGYLLVGGLFSIMTLYGLYNPGVDTFSNADHHTLTFEGFSTENNTLVLLDDHPQNKKLQPIWNNEHLGGYAYLKRDENGLRIDYKLSQPIYSFPKNGLPTVINNEKLLNINREFTLLFADSLGLHIRINDTIFHKGWIDKFYNVIERTPDATSGVYVDFLINGQIKSSAESSFNKLILRSLPLSSIIKDVAIPEDFDIEWNNFDGITLLRDKMYSKIDSIKEGCFKMAFTPNALDFIQKVVVDGHSYTTNQLLSQSSYQLSEGETICIGSGLQASDLISISSNLKEGIRLTYHTPFRYVLPVERDSILSEHSLIVTSSIQSMSESRTTTALYYPIFGTDEYKHHFKVAMAYLPDESLVPLYCKIQSLGDDKPLLINRTDTLNLTNVLCPGDKFILYNPNRYFSPEFSFENLRETVPFNTTKGYSLILIVLLAAGLSMFVGNGKFESRGETVVWMVLMVFMVYRSFLGWRVGVFPPVEQSSLAFTLYRSDTYLWLQMLISIVLLALLFIVYKIYLRFFEKKYSHYTFGKTIYKISAIVCPSLLVLGCILNKFIPSICTDRFAFVLFPVVSFFLSEFFYQRAKYVLLEENLEHNFVYKVVRYVNMLLCVLIPLLKDAGFGIMFFIFILFYLALDGYYKSYMEKHNKLITLGSAIKVFIILFILTFLFYSLSTFIYKFAPIVAFIIFITIFIIGCLFLRKKKQFNYGIYIPLIVAIILLFGAHQIVSFAYRNFLIFTICIYIVVAFISLVWFKYIANHKLSSKNYIWIPLLIFFAIAFHLFGEKFLNSNRHLLYRSEVHIEEIDRILMNEEAETRDLERLFETSQNRWYLGYYMDGRSWKQFDPTTGQYQLRPHFNKGVTWHTQKTDVVISRFLIGEHSVMAVYVLIIVLILLFLSVFSSVRSKTKNQYTLLGLGAALFLLCQAIFITLTVTNRFIFFGQDFPLLSLASSLTIILTILMLAVVGISTITKQNDKIFNPKYNYPDNKPMIFILLIFGMMLVTDHTLVSNNKENFNVYEAINQTRIELKSINDRLIRFQKDHNEELASNGYLKHLKTEKKGVKQSKSEYQTKKIQTDFYDFINFFDQSTALGDSLFSQLGNEQSSISRFTASLYRIYRDEFSKHNRSSDIIHLRAKSNGVMEFNVNASYYMLTTPETDEQVWRGNIIPSKSKNQHPLIVFERGTSQYPIQTLEKAERFDSRSDITYKYRLYLAKINPEWVPNGEDLFIVGRKGNRMEDTEVAMKTGVLYYRLGDEQQPSHTLIARTDDYLSVQVADKKGEEQARLYLKGDQGKYFARNLLINGKRRMIYPLGDKFFYPYHVASLMSSIHSGDDKKLRETDKELTLSYTLSEQLYNVMNHFKKNEGDARSLIVADGDGCIRALVSVKNKMKDNGYIQIDPNDVEKISEYMDDYYMSGDNIGEQRTFGDLNLVHLNLGPGSSIKPITFAAVTSQVYADWRDLSMYLNPVEQDLQLDDKYIHAHHYAGHAVKFRSLYGDESGYSKPFGKFGVKETDIRRYMQKSSNYFNSLFVFMGYYDGKYISNELAKVKKGLQSDLFMPYMKEDKANNFPAFYLSTDKGRSRFVFRQWLDKDNLPTHENGAFHSGLIENFKLWDKYPEYIFNSDQKESIDLFELDEDKLLKKRYNYPFAFPQISFIPEEERITSEQMHASIRSTTLGANPFHVTPLKMAEMYGKLFTLNSNYRLTLNPTRILSEKQNFSRSEGYKKGPYYEDILLNHLFVGMNDVWREGGTASWIERQLGDLIRKKGLYIYAKTGTISDEQSKNKKDTQLLGLVISKNCLHGYDMTNKEEMRKAGEAIRTNRFYVMYFLSEKETHKRNIVNDAIRTVLNSSEFAKYMELH